MNKKKSLILVGLLIVLMICLTGCGTKEIIIKNVDKDEEIAKIELNVNEDALKGELNNVSDSNSNEENDSSQEENEFITNENSSNNEVVKVDCVDIYAEERYLIIYGYDKNANIVWQYKTPIESPVPEFTNLEYIGEYDHELVYLNEFGTIKALDFQTGEVLFSNNEYQDGQSVSHIDLSGNLYLNGAYKLEDVVFIMDKEGKTVKKIDISGYVDEKKAPWAVDLVTMSTICSGDEAIELHITYEGYTEENIDEVTVLIMDLETYECEVKAHIRPWEE